MLCALDLVYMRDILLSPGKYGPSPALLEQTLEHLALAIVASRIFTRIYIRILHTSMRMIVTIRIILEIRRTAALTTTSLVRTA